MLFPGKLLIVAINTCDVGSNVVTLNDCVCCCHATAPIAFEGCAVLMHNCNDILNYKVAISDIQESSGDWIRGSKHMVTRSQQHAMWEGVGLSNNRE